MTQITQKIPVTVITGFLGTGKTTFINQLLKLYPNTKFALVENEFGEVSIDTNLITGVDASGMFELKNGCICCTITDEFELILEELIHRFPDVEHLLIETTGIADPAPVVAPFLTDNKIKQYYSYNGTVCIADAQNFNHQPEFELRNKQLAVADLIILNKIETEGIESIAKIIARIGNISPFSSILQAQFGVAEGFSLSDINLTSNKLIDGKSTTKHSHSRVIQKTIIIYEPLNKPKFSEWLNYTLDIHKKDIYRVKGILYFEGEPFEYILQGIGGNYEILEGDLNTKNEHTTKLVFIGKLKGIEINPVFT